MADHEKRDFTGQAEQRFIFGSLFLLSNKLQIIGDQFLAEGGMTLRQWFLTVMIQQFDAPDGPTLGEVARLMGTSHQNVKQLALKLQEKEFLTLAKDTRDARILRLRLTEKCHSFWAARAESQGRFIDQLFSGTKPEDALATKVLFLQLLENIEQWDTPT